MSSGLATNGARAAQAESGAREAKRVLAAVAAAVDAKDHHTHSHSQRVSAWTWDIAIELDLGAENVASLIVAGRLHDVGKIAVPDSIVQKEGKLSPDERNAMERHSAAGERILRAIGLPEIAPWVRHHHERWDGGGYPDGIGGEDIPREARILAAADSFDAMTHARSYQRTLSVPEAIVEIGANRGTQFDPEVADALVDILARREGGGEIRVADPVSAVSRPRLVPAPVMAALIETGR